MTTIGITTSTDMLEQVAAMTKRMRSHEAEVVEIAKERRKILRTLRDQNVPYRQIAEAMGTSEQAVYKDLRWGGQQKAPKES